nr:structural protein [Tolivirales sp.]
MHYSIRYHGNYCGPGWSDGKRQSSVIGSTPPTDEFDATCMAHDATYAVTDSADLLTNADLLFASQNIPSLDAKRVLAGVAVGTQGLLRGLDSIITNQISTIKMTKKLRGSPTPKQTIPNKPKLTKPGTSLTTVPAAYGFSLKMTPPKIRRNGNTSHIVGSDYAGSIAAVNTISYQPAASVFLNPAYFQNAMLGSQARAYEKFRFTRATIHYIPSVPTSTQGQLVMCSTRTVKEPFFNGASTTFLSKALSQGNAIATPLWKEAMLDVPCSNEWSIVDALIDSDLDDSIQEEIQCYCTSDFTGTAGILMLHYEIEFKDPLYTYHPTLIPVPVGNGSIVTLKDNAAAKGVNDSVALNDPTGFVLGANSSVYRLIFRQEASTLPTGPTSWAGVAKVETLTGSTSTATTIGNTNIALSTGSVLYGVVNGTNLHLYTSYDTAANANLAGQLLYQTVVTAKGTWHFHIHLVRMADSERISSQ